MELEHSCFEAIQDWQDQDELEFEEAQEEYDEEPAGSLALGSLVYVSDCM